MTTLPNETPIWRTSKTFHWPLAYDLLLATIWGRKESEYRRTVLGLADIRQGDSVLDLGCCTGTLAIAARRRVGSAGRVAGIDASREMIARARRKAAKLSVEIEFVLASADTLPFSDASFDVVLTTTVLHCLPRSGLAECFAEMQRGLRSSGRLLVVDFAHSEEPRYSLIAHMRHHRNFDLYGVAPDLEQAGFMMIKSGAVDFSDLHYVLAEPANR